jgi:hypothetical protein
VRKVSRVRVDLEILKVHQSLWKMYSLHFPGWADEIYPLDPDVVFCSRLLYTREPSFGDK